jgi:hypothetical protein
LTQSFTDQKNVGLGVFNQQDLLLVLRHENFLKDVSFENLAHW